MISRPVQAAASDRWREVIRWRICDSPLFPGLEIDGIEILIAIAVGAMTRLGIRRPGDASWRDVIASVTREVDRRRCDRERT
jgi:hypothetical protein